MDTLSAMHNVTSCYFGLGRFAEALKIGDETLVACRRALPKDHPQTLATMHGLPVNYDRVQMFGFGVMFH